MLYMTPSIVLLWLLNIFYHIYLMLLDHKIAVITFIYSANSPNEEKQCARNYDKEDKKLSKT